MNKIRSNFKTSSLRVSVLSSAIVLLLAGCSSAEKEPPETEEVIMVQTAQNQSSPEANDMVYADVSHEALTVTGRRESAVLQRAAMPGKMMILPQRPQVDSANTENYQNYPENGVWTVAEQPLSTFSVDVDTASYANVRRMLQQGQTPPKEAVRIEELINYFDYQYPQPNDDTPFNVDTQVAKSPLDSNKHLVRIALSGKQISAEQRKPSNLVFLLDVSGSMSADNKLPLLKRALTMLVNKLDERDSVAIVVYAGASGVVLEPTSGNDKLSIVHALEKLQAGGSTNGASGINLAYQMAQKAFKKDGVNRVLLATDGDFNVGTTDHDALISLIEKQRESGVSLSVLGFGNGNYNDHLTEQLADKGNGNAAYIDNINEARKVLVEQLTGTLQTIAKDVKIQVEFNPEVVHEYRLIGYENRMLAKEDFNNDKVDAGELGAGHTVTALYEITLKNAQQYTVDELHFNKRQSNTGNQEDIALVKLRYKAPDGDTSKKIEKLIATRDIIEFSATDNAFRFAHSVAGFGQLLKQSKFVSMDDASALLSYAKAAKGDDQHGYRAEFIRMLENWILLQVKVSNANQNNGSAIVKVVES